MRAPWTLKTIQWTLVGLLGSIVVLIDALATSHLPRGPQTLMNTYLPWLRSLPVQKVLHVLASIACAGMFAAWIALRPKKGQPGVPVLPILGLWCLPLLLSPPAMTADPYAYAAQGWLLANGLDPYTVEMGMRGPYTAGIYHAWRPTTAVYPPFALQLQQLVVEATGAHPWWGVVGMRAIALLGVALMIAATILLARDLGLSTRLALWGAVLNPLVVVQLIGGAHNDSMMIGLVMLAVWLARRPHGLITGAAMIGLAAMFKQPAVLAGLGVVLVALPERLRVRPVQWLPILGRLAVGGVIGGAVFAGLSLLSGLGFGWMNKSAGSPTLVINHTPLSWVAQLAIKHGQVPQSIVDPVLTAVSGVLMLTAIAWSIRRFALDRPILLTAAILLAFGLLGSALQPWYVLWGGPLLALANVSHRAERIACAVVLQMLVSGPLAWVVNPMIHVTFAAIVAFIWWRVTESRAQDDSEAAHGVATPVG